jgi:hypothetical protein
MAGNRTLAEAGCDHRNDVDAGELLAASQVSQLDEKSDADDHAAHFPDQLDGGGHSSPRREKVIDQENALPLGDGVLVDGESTRPVFELVLQLVDVGWEFPRLTHGNEPRRQQEGKRRPQNEAAGLDADDLVDLLVLVVRREPLNDLLKGRLVLEQSRDVPEEDPLLGKIRDVAMRLFKSTGFRSSNEPSVSAKR